MNHKIQSTESKSPRSSHLKRASFISLFYLALGIFWIVLSDWGLYRAFGDQPEAFAMFEAYKGILFIAISAVLIHLISFKVLQRQHQADVALTTEEERYRNLVSNLPVGVYYTNTKGKIEYLNARCTELFGLKAGEALGDAWQQQLSESDRHKVLEKKQQAFREESICLLQYTLVHNDLRRVTVLDSFRPLRDAGGSVTGFMGTLTDCTEISKSTHLREESESRFHDLVYNSHSGIFILRGEGFVFVNPRLSQILGASIEELLAARSLFNFFDCTNLEELRLKINYCQNNTGANFSQRIRMSVHSGTVMDAEFKGFHEKWEGQQAIMGMITPIVDENAVSNSANTMKQETSDSSSDLTLPPTQAASTQASEQQDDLLLRLNELTDDERKALLILLRH